MWDKFVDRLPTLGECWQRAKRGRVWWIVFAVGVLVILLIAAVRASGAGGVIASLFGGGKGGGDREVVRRSTAERISGQPRQFEAEFHERAAAAEARRVEAARDAAGRADRTPHGLSERLKELARRRDERRSARGAGSPGNGTSRGQ